MARPGIVDAYVRRYTRAQIETALDRALADYAAGTKITSSSFEGGGTSATIAGKVEDVIELLQDCLVILDNNGAKPARQLFVRADLSYSETEGVQ